MAHCYFCGMEIRDPRSVGRSSTCPDCGKDLKICLNCDFYDQNAHWECRESISERVAEKDRGNFCDFFRFSGKPFAGNSGKDDKAYKARSDLKNLFGDE